MSDINLLKDMTEAIQATGKQQARTTAYDTEAEVRRCEDGTAWVHIPGGVDETPVRLTIAAKAGDTVQIRVSGGTAWMVGNATAPPTDDTRAKQAEMEAREAAGTATNFVTDTRDGVFVHPKNNTKDGVRIQKTVEIIRAGESVAEYGDSVRVGKADGGHVEINAEGMRLCVSDGSIPIAVIGYADMGGYWAPFFTLGSRTPGSTIGDDSVTEGSDLTASGSAAHAEGIGCKATGNYSHAEGSGTEASGSYSHAEGRTAKASGKYSHAEGFTTTAAGESSHAGGDYCVASGYGTFAHGIGNAAPYEAQTVFGKYAAQLVSGDLFVVGNGTDDLNRNDAMRLMTNGRVEFSGAVGSGLSWDTRTEMVNAASGLPQNRPYLFAAGATWANTANAGSNAAFGIICKTSTTDWRLLFMAGANVYKSIFTWDGTGTTTGTFSTTQIG